VSGRDGERRAIMLLRIMSALALLAAAVSFAAMPATAQTMAKLNVATTPNDSGAEVYYAVDMGFFKKAGLDVTITTLNNGGLIGAGVASGSFDVAQASLSSIASAHERGINFVIVAPAALYISDRPTSALIVTKTSPIASAKDLEGKVIAVNGLFNVTQVGPEAWIEQNGGNLASVKFIELPFADMPGALASGRIDAAQVSEPALDAALKGGARILAPAYDAIGKRFLLAGWFSTTAWADANPDIARKFNAVMIETARWANANPALSAKILEKYTKLPVSPTMSRVLYPERAQPSEAQPLIDASARYKALHKTFPASEIFAKTLL
jgi:NitT/TauT family transport system substrate-binding protein